MGSTETEGVKMGESLLLTCHEARELLGGISRTTLNRWANEWGLRKVGHRFVRADIVEAVSKHGLIQNGGKSDGSNDGADDLRD